VPGLPLLKELKEVDGRKVVGLIIDPKTLSNIRANRMSVMGVEGEQTAYNNLRKIEEEVAWAKKLYQDHPDWLVLDVTLRGVEETAARILRAMSDRTGDVHPLWQQGVKIMQGVALD